MFLPYLQAFLAIFGVMDPVGNVPVFLTLTSEMSKRQKRRIAIKATLRASIILLLFVFLGNWILDAFQISFESFRIAGGLVLVVLGFQILFGMKFNQNTSAEEDISVVPLAMPLIAGPGTITTAVILTKEFGYAATLSGLAANLLLSLLLFKYAHVVTKLLGKKGSIVFARVMGLILIAIGVELVRNALLA